MKVEIITTGNEILDGRIVDTNSSWISERLFEFGHRVMRMQSVGDDRSDIIGALRSVEDKTDCVIVTGGLGPTTDDITIDAATEAFNLELKLDETAVGWMKEFFDGIGRRMTQANLKQAHLPRGAKSLRNMVGTACGVELDNNGKKYFFLPGVPRELYQIFDDSIVPFLMENKDGFISKRTLRCFGMPEAEIADLLRDIDLKDLYVSYRVPFPEVIITLFARSNDEKENQRRLAEGSQKIKDILKDAVYAEGEITLPEVMLDRMRLFGKRLAVAESCTGGMISNTITNISGASDVFERGYITYSNNSKVDSIGVDSVVIEKNGAVSAEVALQMARMVREISKADFGLSATGIAGPTGGTDKKPVGLVFIGLSSVKGDKVKKFNFPFERERFKRIVSYTSLKMLMDELGG